MKVILVGYSKTGTKTLATAFTMLGLNTYDAMENFYYLHKDWMRVFRGEASSEDIKRMFDGVDALTDSPVFYYWEELSKAFPEAKIILTIRDEDSWYRSLKNQFEVLNKSYLAKFLNVFSLQLINRQAYRLYTGRFIGELAGWPFSTVTLHHEKLLRAHYRQHNQEVLEKAPKDRLLVYKVSEGWEPLCKFLDIEIPDKPFPHKNQGGELLEEWRKSNTIVQSIMMQSIAGAVLVFLAAGYGGYRLCRTAACKSFAASTNKYLLDSLQSLCSGRPCVASYNGATFN